jgi:NAD(P)H-hydrate epimerase
MGVIAANAVGVLRKNIERSTAMLLGPGFGLEDTTRDFVEGLIGSGRKSGRGAIGFVRPIPGETEAQQSSLPPLVVDADGLKLLARLQNWARSLPAPTVLTPHPGEMAILTGLSTAEIQADRLDTAERFAREWGHVVVLKVLYRSGLSGRPNHGHPGGDTGPGQGRHGRCAGRLITGLRAQGMDAFKAAVAGAWIHAQAGLRAAELGGSFCVGWRCFRRVVDDERAAKSGAEEEKDPVHQAGSFSSSVETDFVLYRRSGLLAGLFALGLFGKLFWSSR